MAVVVHPTLLFLAISMASMLALCQAVSLPKIDALGANSLPSSPPHTKDLGSEAPLAPNPEAVNIAGISSEYGAEPGSSIDSDSRKVVTRSVGPKEGPEDAAPPRAIMEDFTHDFLSPADDNDLSSDFFNSEPFYYDLYYDSYDEPEGAGAVDDTLENSPNDIGNSSSVKAVEEKKLEGEGESMHDTLDLRLLGADLQSELGFVLEQLTNGSQRNRRHQAPIRHHDPRFTSGGIPVGGPREGSCPPPVHSLPPGLCGAPPCTSHMMCYPLQMCCFNGCTYTCTEPVKPPPVIDWFEDTGSRLPVLDPSNPALPLKFESSPLSYGTGGGETIRLPGGCSLSAQRYEELKQFMTADSIQDCLCSGGEVVCVVKSSP